MAATQAQTHNFTSKTNAKEIVDAFGTGQYLAGKTAVVTGGNVGIGLETVKVLAYAGARVILASRSIENGLKAIEEEIKKPGHGGYSVSDASKIVVKQLELGSLKSVKAFAEDLIKTEERIDLLIFNAGVFQADFEYTVDGFEKHIGVNHFGHFYLYQLLESKLQKQDFPSRVVVVSSLAHGRGTIDHQDLHYRNKRETFDGIVAYGHSKLANILFAREVADRNKTTKVNAFSLHPGVIRTNLVRTEATKAHPALSVLETLIDKDIPQGAATTIYVALAPELNEDKYRGLYFADSAAKDPNTDEAIDADGTGRKKLWELTEKQLQDALKTIS